MNYFRILQLLKPLVQRGSIKSIDEALVFLQRQGTKVDGILRKGVENMFKKIKARDPDFNKVVQKLPKDDAGIPFNPNTLKSVAEKNRRVFEKLMKDRGVDASGLKLAKPLKKSSKSFLEEMADRGHKVLKPGTPEYEAYIKKGLRTFPGGRVSEKRGVGSLFKETKDKAIKFYDDIVEESTALAKRTGKDVRGLIEERIGYKFTGKESMDDIITIIKEKFFKDGGLATLFEGRTDGN
jgi:hypothetical protein